MSYQSQVNDEENPHNENALKRSLSEITDTSVRLGFIRKVFGIVSFQLLITIAWTILMMYSPGMVSWVLNNYWIIWVDLVLILVIEILVICVRSIGRRSPHNYICLTIFTLGFSLMVGCCAAVSDPKIVFMAAVMTLFITLALTTYAYYTKTDLTYCGGFLCIFGMTLMLFGMFMWWGQCSTMNIIYSCLGVIFYGFFLIYDTQLLMGGSRRYKLDIDDYVVAAMMIYIDIIGIFLELLSLLGGKN